MIQTSQSGCVHWCSNGMTAVWATNCFLFGSEACSMERNTCLVWESGSRAYGWWTHRPWWGLGEFTADVLLNRRVVKLPSKYVCLFYTCSLVLLSVLIREASHCRGQWFMQRLITFQNVKNKWLLSPQPWTGHLQYPLQGSWDTAGEIVERV